jgi:hypothetical protein
MSDIKERIKIQETDIRQSEEVIKQVEEKVTEGFKELFNKYRFCDDHNAALELKEKRLYLFYSIESAGYKIYSPDNKMMLDNPFLINKLKCVSGVIPKDKCLHLPFSIKQS